MLDLPAPRSKAKAIMRMSVVDLVSIQFAFPRSYT